MAYMVPYPRDTAPSVSHTACDCHTLCIAWAHVHCWVATDGTSCQRVS